MTTQDELKRIAAEKAVEFVPENEYIGIGTSSTINFSSKPWAKAAKNQRRGFNLQKSSELLAQYDIPVVSLNEVSGLAVYIDGADEVNHALQMIKGGGGAHLNEKSSPAHQKNSSALRMKANMFHVWANSLCPWKSSSARSLVSRKLLAMGGQPELRIGYTTFTATKSSMSTA